MSVEAREPVRSARRDATRERVLDAALVVFAERGVFGGTVEEICERAGFTRGAFYSNFEDKEEVLQALIEREQARLVAYLDANLSLIGDGSGPFAAATEPDADPARVLGVMVDWILASVPGDRLLSLVLTEMEIHAVRQPSSSRLFLDAENRFRERIVAFIEGGIVLLGRELTMDARDLSEAAIAIVERSIRQNLLAGRGDPDAMARAVLPSLILGASRPTPAD